MIRLDKHRDVLVGTLGVGFALVVLFVWIPADVTTGVIDVWRRTIRIGDAMLPTFASIGILAASTGILLRSWLRKSSEHTSPEDLYTINPTYVLSVGAIVGLSLTLMHFAGPVAVQFFTNGGVSYRQLLDTAPWKYTGFFFGGTTIVFGLISLASHTLQWRNIVLAALATAFIAAIYDIPFDTLLLPPNGDY